MTLAKPIPKYLFNPTNHSRSQQRDEPIRVPVVALTRNLLKTREKSRAQGVIGVGLASHWLKNWPEILWPITKRGSNRNRAITLGSHLKTALSLRSEKLNNSH